MDQLFFVMVHHHHYCVHVGGLPLITYASRGGGGVNSNAYKCVQGGRGGLNMTKNTHFVHRYNWSVYPKYEIEVRKLRKISCR